MAWNWSENNLHLFQEIALHLDFVAALLMKTTIKQAHGRGPQGNEINLSGMNVEALKGREMYVQKKQGKGKNAYFPELTTL